MKARAYHKHIVQWQKPFRDGIAHYNGKIHNCKRWRNRRKAQRMWTQSITRSIMKNLAWN